MRRSRRHDRDARAGFRAVTVIKVPIALVFFLLTLGLNGQGGGGGDQEVISESRCFNCLPPEIISMVGKSMTMGTADQLPEDPNGIALSYFGGLITDYSSSPGSTNFRQSRYVSADLEREYDWLFDVELDQDYTPSMDLASSLRKVDEPNQSPDRDECPQGVPNVPGSYVMIDQGDLGMILEDYYHCEYYFPGPNSWHVCHYEVEPPGPHLDPMIRRVLYQRPPMFGCIPLPPDEICVEVSDVNGEFDR